MSLLQNFHCTFVTFMNYNKIWCGRSKTADHRYFANCYMDKYIIYIYKMIQCSSVMQNVCSYNLYEEDKRHVHTHTRGWTGHFFFLTLWSLTFSMNIKQGTGKFILFYIWHTFDKGYIFPVGSTELRYWWRLQGIHPNLSFSTHGLFVP